jgi:hypothetical protein
VWLSTWRHASPAPRHPILGRTETTLLTSLLKCFPVSDQLGLLHELAQHDASEPQADEQPQQQGGFLAPPTYSAVVTGAVDMTITYTKERTVRIAQLGGNGRVCQADERGWRVQGEMVRVLYTAPDGTKTLMCGTDLSVSLDEE